MYKDIVHIKMTLHIQILVYYKNIPTQLIMGLANHNVHDAKCDTRCDRFDL